MASAVQPPPDCMGMGNVMLMTSPLQGLLLDQAKMRRDDLHSLLEGEVQTGLSGLDWKDVCRLLHRELGVRQEAVQILRFMLVHWCSPDGRSIPLANIFKLLRLVTIRHGMPKSVVRNITVCWEQELNFAVEQVTGFTGLSCSN